MLRVRLTFSPLPPCASESVGIGDAKLLRMRCSRFGLRGSLFGHGLEIQAGETAAIVEQVLENTSDTREPVEVVSTPVSTTKQRD